MLRSHWELDENELRLAEKVWNTVGTIYLCQNGYLHEKDKGNYQKVDSKFFEESEYLVFLDEIRTAKILIDFSTNKEWNSRTRSIR